MAEKVRLVACARNYRPCFRENQLNARFLLSENERFGLVFVKTGFINSGTGKIYENKCYMFFGKYGFCTHKIKKVLFPGIDIDSSMVFFLWFDIDSFKNFQV